MSARYYQQVSMSRSLSSPPYLDDIYYNYASPKRSALKLLNDTKKDKTYPLNQSLSFSSQITKRNEYL